MISNSTATGRYVQNNLFICFFFLLRNCDIFFVYNIGKGKGTRYLTSEVPLLSREYSPRKPTVRPFYPPLSISAPF